MKAKNLFIFGLAAALLSGCGGPKKYSQEANKEKFLDIVNQALEGSGMMSKGDAPFYSFEFEYSYESENENKYLKDGSTLSSSESHGKSNRSAKYDSKNALLSDISESDGSSSSDSQNTKTDTRSDVFWQADAKNYYKIDKREKRYQKAEAEKPADKIEQKAINVTNGFYNKFSQIASLVDSKDSKVYADDNVYTIVVDVNETTEGVAVKSHGIYQISISNTLLEYYEETSEEGKELNREYKSSSKTTYKLEKKDLSLKALDLNDYLLNKDSLY